MKKSLFSSVALAGLVLATAASAADLPSRRAPMAPMPAAMPYFTWTGFYIGVNAGYNWSHESKSSVGFVPGVLPASAAGLAPASVGSDGNGFTGGGQIGYNYQMNQFVAGLEADINYVDSKKSSSYALAVPALAATGFTTNSAKLEYLGTVRGRLGFAYDRALVYATGGLAYGGVKNDTTFAVPDLGAAWGGGENKTRFGYAVGGGLEYAITNTISTRIEYLYYDLGSKKYNVVAQNAAATATGASLLVDSKARGSIVRGGINFRF